MKQYQERSSEKDNEITNRLKNKGNYLDGIGKDVCGHCGIKRTKEGHDGCIGTLPNIMNACCGHGENEMAYVQFWNTECIRGKEALDYIKRNKLSELEQHQEEYLDH